MHNHGTFTVATPQVNGWETWNRWRATFSTLFMALDITNLAVTTTRPTFRQKHVMQRLSGQRPCSGVQLSRGPFAEGCSRVSVLQRVKQVTLLVNVTLTELTSVLTAGDLRNGGVHGHTVPRAKPRAANLYRSFGKQLRAAGNV